MDWVEPLSTPKELSMPTRIFLPERLMRAYKFLFPNLDFSRISFYLGKPFTTDSGIPILDNGKAGLTLTSLYSDINIYIREDRYDPCDKRCFALIAHELVHAQQIQDEIFGGKYNFWLLK